MKRKAFLVLVALVGVESTVRAEWGGRGHDFNGDGRSDLLCMDVLNGDLAVDLANSSGQLNGTDSRSSTGFCPEGELLFGDFTGDGRTDLLCHTASAMRIDFADASGRFQGADWVRSTNWCTGSGYDTLVGDFNGDGRTDLLCHRYETGTLWIDYADSSGRFLGSDWTRANAWCKDKILSVGDFNGDGHDDLVCTDRLSGKIWIDYWAPASTPLEVLTAPFSGTDWSASTGCADGAGVLWLPPQFADFNGDGRDDMRCIQFEPGGRFVIDYADSSGRLLGANASYNSANWCEEASDASRRRDTYETTGDYNGDGHTDLFCQVRNYFSFAGVWVLDSSREAVDYADNFGEFNAAADWSRSTDWCTGDFDRVF